MRSCRSAALVAWLAACGEATPPYDGGAGDSGFEVEVTAVSPASGALAGGTQVTVTGDGFAPGLTLLFGDAGATRVQVGSGTSLTATTPAGLALGAVPVTVTTAQGSATLAKGFTYGAVIAYCALTFPAVLTVAPNTPGGPIDGEIYVPGVTDQGTTAGAGIEGQVGYGPPGTTPDETWIWADAGWTGKGGTDNHDDAYAGMLPGVPNEGMYDYAVRFSVDQGTTWTNCDVGSDATYNPANAGQLTVASVNMTGIPYCSVHYPIALTTALGETAGPVYGWVYVPGITDQGTTAGAGITAWLGEGPLGTDPDSDWSWYAATWDAKQGPSGHNDEYHATLPAQNDAGQFAYAFRFALDGGVGDALCDTTGDVIYNPADQGVLTVALPDAGGLDAGPQVGYCNLQYPTSLIGEAFATSTDVYGNVYAAGVTDDAGQGPGIIGQAGYGPLGSDPAQVSSGWSWFSASWYAKSGIASHDDEYAATLVFADAGSYALAYRFSLNDGGFSYCDTAGDVIYAPANQGTLTVVPPPLVAAWCDLQYPPAITAAPGSDAGLVYGQVYYKGITDALGQGADVWAELGVGPAGADPRLVDGGFVWETAVYDGDRDLSASSCNGACPNDEYQAPLGVPATPGLYNYYFRFSLDDGNVWTLCGSSAPIGLDGGQGGDAGVLTVTGGTGNDSEPSYCALQSPLTLLGEAGAATTPLVGQVYAKGITDDAGPGPGIIGQAGIGPLGSVPGQQPIGWSWTSASWVGKAGSTGNNDAYGASIVLPAPGSYALAFRFSLDGGPFVYCDPAGDADYDAGSEAVATVVAAPLTVDWCDVQYPLTIAAAAGSDAGLVYGQVYKQGVTDSPGQGADVWAQLGVGPHGADPTTDGGAFAWAWATYDGDRNGDANDEYALPLIVPSDAGSYDYYFRFTLDDGNTWTVCETGGPYVSDGGDGVSGALTAE